MTTIDIDIPTVTDSESAFHAAAAISSVLARNSVVSERDGKPPRDEIALLRKSGLLRYLVPQRHGGPGGTWPDALRITRTIAGGNGSVGQLLGYHYLNSITPRVVGTAEQAFKDLTPREIGVARCDHVLKQLAKQNCNRAKQLPGHLVEGRWAGTRRRKVPR